MIPAGPEPDGTSGVAAAVRVSVVVPAYNAGTSLERAVRSALAQTLADIEVLVIDDGSSDDTAVIAATLASRDRRVRVLGDGRNHGVSVARNTGFAAARGEWIAVLDGDDAYVPDRLECLVAAAERHGADMVADDLGYWDWHAGQSAGRAIGLIGAFAAAPSDDGDEPIDTERFLANCITGRSPFDYGQLKAMIRRDFIERHRLAYIAGMRHGEDFMFYAQALLSGATFVRIDHPGYLYTQRVGSVSRTRSQVARTVENNEDMRRHTLALLDMPAVRASPRLRALLWRRARAIRWHASWEGVYHPLRERRLGPVLLAAIRDWRVPPLLVKRLIERMMKQVAG